MFRFLSAEALYGLLLVTTFASVGLLGLWAATSRWHPFLRTTIVLAILSVLLLRPMFEPFVMLVSQVATIAAGVAVYRWVKNRKDATNLKRTRYQFSLKTLLFVSTLVAMGAAVVAKLPELGWRVWFGITINGIEAGLGSLLSVTLVIGRMTWWRVALIFGAIVLNASAIAEAHTPFISFFASIASNGTPIGRQPLKLLVLGGLQTFLQLLVSFLGHNQISTADGESTLGRSHALPKSALMLFLLVFALPSYFLWQLVNPLAMPARNLMDPNAFDELVKLGHSIGNSQFMAAYNSDPLDKKLLEQEVKNHTSEYELLFVLLQHSSVIPEPDEVHRFRPGYWARSLAYALEARGDVAHETQDFKMAMDSYIKLLPLAQRVRGGLVYDWIVALGIERMAIKGTYRLVQLASESDSQEVAGLMIQYDIEREPLAEVFDRQRRWNQNVEGWQGHLASLFVEEGIGASSIEYAILGLRFNQALNRLLVTELALRKYQLTHNTLPDRLDQLVPDILPEVPRDPFDPADGTLRYKRTDNGYILYSVCKNGIDDGGVPPNEEGTTPADWSQWWSDEHGDLRLDHFFAEP